MKHALLQIGRMPYRRLALFGAALSLVTASPAFAKTANWQNHPSCISRTVLDAPDFRPTRQVHIIGVGMSADGELTRYELKPEVRKSMDDLFVFAKQGEFLDSLTKDDFITMQDWFKRHGSKPDEDMRSHFDVGSDIDKSYIYVLLPRSWVYHEKATSLKIPGKKNKHPFFNTSQPKLTDRAAVVHHKTVPVRDGVNCYYEFNLNLDMVSVVAGKKLSTTIVIDPGGGNEPKKPWD